VQPASQSESRVESFCGYGAAPDPNGNSGWSDDQGEGGGGTRYDVVQAWPSYITASSKQLTIHFAAA
jgi:hypothetical protein